MAQSTGAPSSNASMAMPASPNPRLWDGFDDPYGPAAWNAFGQPQPSRPTPPFGAPHIGQTTINTTQEGPAMSQDEIKGDHSANGGYGHQPLPPLPPQPQK